MKTRRVSALHFLEGAPLGGPVSGPFGPSPSSDLSRPLTPQPRAEAAWPRGLGLLRLPLLRRLLFLPVYSEAHADPTGGQEARPVHTLEAVPPRTRVNSSFSICAPCSGPSAPGGRSCVLHVHLCVPGAEAIPAHSRHSVHTTGSTW